MGRKKGNMVSSVVAGDVQVKSQVRLRVGEIGRKAELELGNGEK